LFAVIQSAGIASLAYVFAQSFNSIVSLPPILSSLADVSIGGVFFPFADLNVKVIAIGLILLLTWVNARGIKTGAGVSTAILLLVFGGIFIIIAFGLSSSHANVVRSFQLTTSNGASVTLSNVFTAMLAAFWAYQGWASIGFIGGEVKNPKKNIPRGIAIGVFIIIALYLLVNITYLSVLPIADLEQIHAAGNKIAAVEAVRTFWGQNGALFISILILVTTLGCTNATILSSSRAYFAMAREGLFFTKVAKLNNHHAPANSLIYQSVWACLLVLSGTFDQLTDMIIFAVFIYYGATTLGVFILRRKMPDAERPYKVWGYPVVPAIVILFCVGLFINTIFTRPREAAIGMVLMLTGVPMYYWFKKNNKQIVYTEENNNI
jgi:APA family basic amino acid/polyamine antiporter